MATGFLIDRRTQATVYLRNQGMSENRDNPFNIESFLNYLEPREEDFHFWCNTREIHEYCAVSFD